MNKDYEAVGLYEHNIRSYRKIVEAFQTEDVVGIIHATGTGKSCNALQLAYDNQEKQIVYLVPSTGIIEHLEKMISDNPNLDRKRDFPNLQFRTYHSLVYLSKEEIASIPCDLLILDEFQHIGAPVWESRMNIMIETHPSMKVFGMTAYTIRGRGTVYERDMVNSDKDELFSNKIVSRYDLCDAMIDGVLPKPVYKGSYIHLMGTLQELEKQLEKRNSNVVYRQYQDLLQSIKRKIQEAPSIPELLKESMKPDGKYIYFCPPVSEEGTNDIETIKKQALEWFRKFVPEENIVFYTTTSEMKGLGKSNREAFYSDQTLDGKLAVGKLRIMFAINQYNEGIHAPNVDGVIMGRATSSDIVFFEQLGRALSVRGDTKKKYEQLDQYSKEELMNMCLNRNIFVKEEISKEEIIQKLLAPVIIDLTNNIDFIKELETNLQDRIKTKLEISNTHSEKRIMKISDAAFDITMQNEDLFEVLKSIRNKLVNTWEDMYELAKAYYQYHKNLNCPKRFKTINGYEYDENGESLGIWIQAQRLGYKGRTGFKITPDRIEKLESIGMLWSIGPQRLSWEEYYELAKAYYEHYGNLLMLRSFTTTNGYDFDKDGIKLGSWLISQRIAYKESRSGKEPNQMIHKISHQQIEQLSSIGMIWEDAKEIRNNATWEKNYELARNYYKVNHDLIIPAIFKTIDGFTEMKEGEEGYDSATNVGSWIQEQRRLYKKNPLNYNLERKRKLESIGMLWSVGPIRAPWEKNYELAKAYYEHNHHLMMSNKFKTKNGYEYDENGVELGRWIATQRRVYSGKQGGKLDKGQIDRLTVIGMVWDVKKNSNDLVHFCTSKGVEFAQNQDALKNISVCEFQIKTAFLEAIGEKIVDENGYLHKIYTMSSPNMQEAYGVTLEELYVNYYVEKGKVR